MTGDIRAYGIGKSGCFSGGPAAVIAIKESCRKCVTCPHRIPHLRGVAPTCGEDVSLIDAAPGRPQREANRIQIIAEQKVSRENCSFAGSLSSNIVFASASFNFRTVASLHRRFTISMSQLSLRSSCHTGSVRPVFF